ncbi:MAG: CRISPR-associated endoribonuclease Cas6 [Melioribacteraceae bacterium]|nr:CRISPR-associated endoribonuclease Cas6 [Melioribacteraceae bacterium]
MRLHFKLTPNIETVPFDYQHYLIGTFHKWMGWNEIHDSISLYSLSWLQGGKMTKNGFDFTKGASWFISFWDESIGKQLIKNAMKDPALFCGLSATEIQIQENPCFREKERFTAASPIFVRKYDENFRAYHLTAKDAETEFHLTETMKTKLKKAGLHYEIKVAFDKTYLNPKTKLVNINNIKSRANFCPVLIEGDPEAIAFAWNVGIGHSTGSGFGALY